MTAPEESRRLVPPGMIANLGSAVVPLVGSLVVSLLLAPYLGDTGYGQYMTVVSAATFLLIGGKFGIHAATSRLLTQHPEDAGTWLRAGLKLRLAFTVGFAILGLALAPLLADRFSADRAAWMAAPVVLTASLLEFGGESLVGLRRFGSLFSTRVASLLLRLLAVAWVRIAQLGSLAFLTGHALSQLLPALWILIGLWRSLPIKPDPARNATRETFAISMPLALSSASFLIYSHTDALMLAWFRDAAAVGQFKVARNILDASLFPIFALTWSLRPALVRAVSQGDADAPRRTLAQGLRGATLYATGAPVLMGLLGSSLVVSLYTTAYTEASRLLLWMLPILLLRGIGAVVFPALLATDRQGVYARIMAWTAGANVLANLLLIPRFGARGAILGTLAALLPLTVWGLWEVRRAIGALPWREYAQSHALALGLSAALGLAGWWWLPRELGLLSAVALGLAGVAILVIPHLVGNRGLSQRNT